jgi:phosphatidylglycerophosphate synthase
MRMVYWRRACQKSSLGAYLDPIADKLLLRNVRCLSMERNFRSGR